MWIVARDLFREISLALFKIPSWKRTLFFKILLIIDLLNIVGRRKLLVVVLVSLIFELVFIRLFKRVIVRLVWHFESYIFYILRSLSFNALKLLFLVLLDVELFFVSFTFPFLDHHWRLTHL